MDFVKYADRLMLIICEEGFAYSNAVSISNSDKNVLDAKNIPDGNVVITPTGASYAGHFFYICIVLCSIY